MIYHAKFGSVVILSLLATSALQTTAFSVQAAETSSATSAISSVDSSGACSGDGSYKDLVLGKEGGADGYFATNPESTATGAYQFLYDTLIDIGVITSGPESVPFGAGEWPSDVVWNPEFATSREDFINNPAAQDRALEAFTQKNLKIVSGSWTEGQVVNGVELTPGGVAFATHMLGTGGFTEWADSGFSPSGLNLEHAESHFKKVKGDEALAAYNNHLMGRVASGGCFDPGMIDIAEANAQLELPPIYLMEWKNDHYDAVLLPGQVARVGAGR